ncbi:MAG: alkyl hydroperoxide reductase, partial [Planctomycetota bacterium]
LPSNEPVGCLIGRSKNPITNPTVTYCNQISRLIQNHCLECHRRGEIGPFSMDEYDEVKGWAEMIVEVVENRRMPPWHATDEHSEFSNARILSDSDRQTFREWLDQGTPYGDATKLPEPLQLTEGWRLARQPDRIISMRERPFKVPADGTVEYQYFVVDPGFKKDVWITAAEVIPGNRSVVHHSIVFVRPPDGSRFRGLGWLAAYVPGQVPPPLRETHARFVPANSKLVFQQHYTPVGTDQDDITKIGILFGDPKEITHEVYTLAALNQSFEIPPLSSSVKVQSEVPQFPRNGSLLGLMPHMHYRGKSFQFYCSDKEVKRQLIDVPSYDFNWQHNYQLKEEIELSDVRSLTCQFEFDNSDQNPFNPDPSETVTWGDQTWEEMAVAFVEVAEPIRSATASKARELEEGDGLTSQPTVEKRAADLVDEFFGRFDYDQDGRIVKHEVPKAIQRFRFGRIDKNDNGILERNELMEMARQRFED